MDRNEDKARYHNSVKVEGASQTAADFIAM
jgi:hypothetical protein